jgi:hypothetical protein
MKALHPTPRFIGAAVALAATALFAVAPVHAQQPESTQQQTDERPLTRAEVNAQTREAMQSGQIVSGEGRPQGPETAITPSKTREERKAETLQARRNGELPVGGNGTYKSSLSQQTATKNSTKTREERKAETLQAIREHKTMQPGESA